MGCGDSKTPLTAEEAAITAQECALGLTMLPVAFVCTTVSKYSRNDLISDSQLMRILRRLFPEKEELEDFKRRYFDRNVLKAGLQEFARAKILSLCVLLSLGSNEDKVTELFYLLDVACEHKVSREQVQTSVATLVQLSVNYGPLLVSDPSPKLAAYRLELERKADSVSAAVVGYIMGALESMSLSQLVVKFNSGTLSRFLSPQGIRRILKEFSIALEPEVKSTKRVSPALPSALRASNRLVAQAGSFE